MDARCEFSDLYVAQCAHCREGVRTLPPLPDIAAEVLSEWVEVYA